MQLKDLLDLLLNGITSEIPVAHEAISLWQQHPNDGAEHAATLLSLLDRCIQASAILGMDGFIGYLQFICDFVEAAAKGTNAQQLHWLAGWDQHAQAYLKNPAANETVSGI